MKTAIVYDTKYGCTAVCVQKLFDMLGDSVRIIDLKTHPKEDVDIHAFDTVIIGGSIYAGQIQKRVRNFCKKYLDTLLTKKIGLFICCMYAGDKARRQLRDNFPPELVEHAVVSGFFGGAFDFEKMNPIERLVVKKVADIDKSVEKISDDSIASFAEIIMSK